MLHSQLLKGIPQTGCFAQEVCSVYKCWRRRDVRFTDDSSSSFDRLFLNYVVPVHCSCATLDKGVSYGDTGNR